MKRSDEPDLIEQARHALAAGERSRAQALLAQALKRNPQQARAWLLLAEIVDRPEQRRYCLEKAGALQSALKPATEPPAEDRRAPVAPAGESRPPVGDPPGAAAQAHGPQPARARPRSKLRSCLGGLLALILLTALAGVTLPALRGVSVAGVGPFDLASWLMSVVPGARPPAHAGAYRGPAPTIGLPRPPTWTPSPSALPAEALAPRPTLNWMTTPSAPAASITPFWGEWKIVIGYSAQGRPIEVYRFGSGKKERMIVAGIHGGDEWNTIALADELIEHVRRRPGLVPPGYTLYILRALNPDGEARGHNTDGRLNANGVDLNRNFDTNWKSAWRAVGCSSEPGTGGSGPGSEPETKALKAFLAERQVEALINYHSAGLGVFPSGDPAHPDSVRLAEGIAAISRYVYPPIKTGCEYTGTLVDWAADHGVLAAVDLELNTLNQTEFDANRKILELLMTFDVARPLATPTPTR